MDDEAERMRILEMIEAGSISAEQGLLLLQALNGEPEDDEPLESEAPADDLEAGWAALDLPAPALDAAPAAPESRLPPLPIPQEPAGHIVELPDSFDGDSPSAEPEILFAPGRSGPPEGLPAEAVRWKRFWTIPLWIGVGITVLGGLLMFLAVRPSGAVTGWFVCASFPFALGVLVLALAWASRSAPWLHLRVQQAPGAVPQRIALSLPLPLGLAAWILRTFRHYIPGMPDENVDQMILAVGRSATPENPIYIQVDEGDDGEKVEIYIG